MGGGAPIRSKPIQRGNPNRKSLRQWAEEVISQNERLVGRKPSVKIQERGLHPEKAETFEELIWSLIPMEGGLSEDV